MSQSTIIQENTTHKAVKENGIINLYIKGFEIDDMKYDDEMIRTHLNKEDLWAIFESLNEENRCLAAEFESTFK